MPERGNRRRRRAAGRVHLRIAAKTARTEAMTMLPEIAETRRGTAEMKRKTPPEKAGLEGGA